MEFEWDELKRAQVIAERALDFVDAYVFFDGRPASHQPTHCGGAMENDCNHRRRARHVSLVLARRESPRHYNEASA
jgi:uncharacterized DUF497 family protein